MLVKELHERIADYACGRISLIAFQDWFVPNTWSARHSGDRSEIELVREIDLRLAEYTNGHLGEQELKDKLSGMLISVDDICSHSATTVDIIRQPEMQIRSFHIGLVEEPESRIPLGA